MKPEGGGEVADFPIYLEAIKLLSEPGYKSVCGASSLEAKTVSEKPGGRETPDGQEPTFPVSEAKFQEMWVSIITRGFLWWQCHDKMERSTSGGVKVGRLSSFYHGSKLLVYIS